MAIQPGVWGIDLGQCALKAIRLQEIDGQVTATAFDYVEHPKILSQPDADPDQLTREALEKFLSRNNLRGDIVCISVPGQSGLARFVKLPPVEEKKISDIVRFEAKQQIPFNLEEVVWDYQKIGSGVVTEGFAMETEIGLFAMKRDMVNRYLAHFKDVNVEVHIVQMAPLSLCNFVAYDLLGKGADGTAAEGDGEEADRRACVVALDIGADSSNLIITDGGRIIWQRPIPLGGNHFTRALTKDLKLTFAKAEHLKRNATKSPDLKKILAALKPVLNDFVSEVQRSLAFFTNTHRDAQIEYMMGLGNAFRLPGLQRFLGEKLQLDVRKLAKMERLTGDAVVTQQVFTENILSFGVAYGLALQGLNRSRLITNLLPGEIRIERLVRAKKPWAAAAAAALLLGSGAFAFSYYLDNRPYADPRVKKAEEASKSTASKAAKAQSEFEAARKKAMDEEEAVKSIVAGQMERRNWLALLKYIDQAVPKPDGSNLPPDMVKYYLDTPPDPSAHPNQHGAMSGREAFRKFQERIKGIQKPASRENPAPGEELGEGIDDLVEFNIETIDARFCDDLGAYWRAVRSSQDRMEKESVRPMSDFGKPPDGRGWVVELRGYTFHHKMQPFVVDTLVSNLARFGGAVEQAPAAGAPGKPGDKPAATGTATGGQPAKTDGKPDAKAEANADPIQGRISHVCLYLAQPKRTADTAAFDKITNGYVGELVGSVPRATAGGSGPTAPAGGGAGGGGMMGMMGMSGQQMMMAQGMGLVGGTAGRGGENWNPLSTATLAGASGGMAPGGMLGGPAGGGGPVRPGPSLAGLGGGEGGPRPGVPPPSATESGQKVPHVRTEFVVLFIWKEATPSDDLRGMGSGEAPGGKR
jgi:type IV pilus assembly protein PilM